VLLLALAGCSKVGVNVNTGAPKDSVKATKIGETTAGTGDARCSGSQPNQEVSEYDNSGDGIPDVRKVFLRIGDDLSGRLVMICRESDVNSDGRKDVVRYYDDEGRTLREESDRNFDAKMDMVSVYQDGKIVRQELDDNFDGRIESKIFFENTKPLRAERDLAGRSTQAKWQPDRWEYYEDGRMVRMGTDLDGDEKVDRWDRDASWKRAQEAVAPNVAGQDG
jgi:hypothetical protein